MRAIGARPPLWRRRFQGRPAPSCPVYPRCPNPSPQASKGRVVAGQAVEAAHLQTWKEVTYTSYVRQYLKSATCLREACVCVCTVPAFRRSACVPVPTPAGIDSDVCCFELKPHPIALPCVHSLHASGESLVLSGQLDHGTVVLLISSVNTACMYADPPPPLHGRSQPGE